MSDSINSNRSKKNILVSLSSQIVLMALSLILPRLIITSFGSEINGFFSTLTQFYSYLEVLRAGVGMAAIQALYKPIVCNNTDEISIIISSSKSYFKKLGYLYLFLIIIISIGFVLYGNDSLNSAEILAIALMQGVSGWISFSLINWFIDLLRAEGKNYIFVSIQTIGTIATKILEIVLLLTTSNPVLVKSATLLIITIECLVFFFYRKRYYSNYNFHSEPNYSLLKNRQSYLSFHISSLVCTNTDIVVLSLFCGYKVASVYSIYYMIVVGVNAIINTVYSSTSYLLGHSYQQGLNRFSIVHDTYYLVYTTLTASLFSICYVLMLPFIKLYTSGVTDIDYHYAYLPFLFCMIQLLTCSKNVGEITVNVGGLANKVVWRSILEATINIVISIVLVNFIGIYGVLIGTIIALLYRVLDVMRFSNKYVLNRSSFCRISVLLQNIVLFILITFINKFLPFNVNSYTNLLFVALIISPLILLLFWGVAYITNKEKIRFVIAFMKNKYANDIEELES